jgi:5-(carboxyamino)imidazole ribonucleotide synthase
MIRRRIGVLGGGQLGQMMALAGVPLDARFAVLDPAPDACATAVARHIHGAFHDVEAATGLAEWADVVTYEFEHLHLPTVEAIAERCEVHPAPAVLGLVQDRISQKRELARLGIPTAPFAAIESAADVAEAAARIGAPGILKTARDGYDGKGQRRVSSPDDLAQAWASVGSKRCIYEGFVRFAREVSLISCRGRDGDIRCWPLAENVHTGGILRRSIAPAPGTTPALQAQAEDLAKRLLTAFGYVGTFTIECFQVGDQLVVNELAPRVHNSGHWTMEGAVTSQFENHVRALMGLPLGDTSPRGHAAMVNLIGVRPDIIKLMALPGVHLHDYGKSERQGRKLGHVTLVDADPQRLLERLSAVEVLVPPATAAP